MTRRGQALVETLVAAVAVTALFFASFRLARALTGHILVEYAAMRVARARAVGMNDFMCTKAARLAIVPVAGRRTWPEGEAFDGEDVELGRFGNYLLAADGAVARGILDYEGWERLRVEPGDGRDVRVSYALGDFPLEGAAGVESHAPLYLTGGL